MQRLYTTPLREQCSCDTPADSLPLLDVLLTHSYTPRNTSAVELEAGPVPLEGWAVRIAFVNPQGNFDPADSHLTAHPDFGGQLVYVKQVALALAEMGHEADILTRQIADEEWPQFAAAEDAYLGCPGVRILRFPCGPPHFLPKEELWSHLSEWVGHIERWYRIEGVWPSLWTGHYADGGLCAALLEELSGVPFTFAAHSLGAAKLDRLLHPDDPNHTLEALDARYNFGARIAAERAAVARSACVITSTSHERHKEYQHPAYLDVINAGEDSRFALIPPGVDLTLFAPEGKGLCEESVLEAVASALARDILPERRGLPAVISWSRLDPTKNHLGLVRAFAESAELRECANLLIITRGVPDPLRKPWTAPAPEQEVLLSLASTIEDTGLWGTVTAFSLEGQDAAAALYRWGVQRGAVFCLPSHHEPFGLSLLEAMAVGLPVVATENGGPREITDDGRAGLLASPDDPAEIGAHLARLLNDRETWRHYSSLGRSRVLEQYSWTRAAHSYAELAMETAAGWRAGDRSYPLPEFVRQTPPVKLPRLAGWVRATTR